MDDDLLAIGAEQKAEDSKDGEGKQHSRREYSDSSITRSFRPPENIRAETINARYEDGVLRISFPRCILPRASKQITIQQGG